ncbi:MAG TPA: hypothetical protein VHL79_05750 [Ramlibacter sp.]|jgi:hypothetical protein|nr:hypothetical protein [Ramlibacter sp.]
MQGLWHGVIAPTAIAFAAALAVAAHAQQAPQKPPAPGQQVRLRLANNLCNSMTNQTLTTQLVPPLASTAGAETSINTSLLQRMEQRRDTYFSQLDGLVPFNGLYATGQLDQSFQEDRGARYAFGLEWELYDQGRGESRRQLDRIRLDNKVQYLQVLRDTEARQVQEQLLAVDQMRNKLLATLYQREVAAVRPVLERRRQELAAGRATRAEVAEIEYKAERAALRTQHYVNARDVLVYPQAQDLINRIEDVQLHPERELTERAVSRSPEIQLQTLLAERAAFIPSPEDNLSVRLYLERTKEFDRGPSHIAGVRVRIPLDRDRNRPQLQQASRELYEEQKESMRAALSQKLSLLTERLRLKQNDMRLLQAESRMVRQKAELSCYRLEHPVASLPDTADRDVEEFTLRLVELQREILTARLDVLEVLTQVSAMVKPREPQELYSLRPAPR